MWNRSQESEESAQAGRLVRALQAHFVAALERLEREHAALPARMTPSRWRRDEGRHGGGERFGCSRTEVFDRASINVSVVHYDDLPDKRLAAATALSAIVHPAHPRAPSIHLHISWTELREASGSWRIMADLNPALPDPEHRERFHNALARVMPQGLPAALAQGDRYFYIPALERHRGVYHLYLEGHHSGDFEADRTRADRCARAAIDCWAEIVDRALHRHPAPTPEERSAQLRYHSLYLFQVLTLDRGTTSGLLVHAQNDLGILGSLPSRVDRELIRSWGTRLPPVQQPLVQAIVEALPPEHPSPVDDPVKRRLAEALRAHYRAHPEALEHQARGDRLPPTVANHR